MNSLTAVAYFAALFASFQVLVEGGDWKCNSCGVNYEAVGCFKDTSGRALPKEILNERDPSSAVYGHRLINWVDWNTYMEGFACRCAAAAKKKGYSVFGLQFFGECWSGPDSITISHFKEFGLSKNCYSQDYQKCTPWSRNCVGDKWTNFIYIIIPDCDLEIERLGCFRDRHSAKRPIPDYILTDRDPSSKKIYSGKTIDWRNWDVYMPSFACRCAKKALEKGYTTFGLQFYGECWSGPEADSTYMIDGISKDCVDRCYKPCRPYEKFCAGKNYADAVYRLSAAPCEIKTQPLGCYVEKADNRALGVEILDELSPVSSVFNGRILDMSKWAKEFPKLLCRCARAAKEKGFSVFGVYNKATCWAAKQGSGVYNKYGKSSSCFKGKLPCPGNSGNCAGGKHSLFAYKIIVPSKKRSYIPHDKKRFGGNAQDHKNKMLKEDEEYPMDNLSTVDDIFGQI